MSSFSPRISVSMRQTAGMPCVLVGFVLGASWVIGAWRWLAREHVRMQMVRHFDVLLCDWRGAGRQVTSRTTTGAAKCASWWWTMMSTFVYLFSLVFPFLYFWRGLYLAASRATSWWVMRGYVRLLFWFCFFDLVGFVCQNNAREAYLFRSLRGRDSMRSRGRHVDTQRGAFPCTA